MTICGQLLTFDSTSHIHRTTLVKKESPCNAKESFSEDIRREQHACNIVLSEWSREKIM